MSIGDLPAVKSAQDEARPLTEQQRAFVRLTVSGAGPPSAAAREAGFAFPSQEAYRLMRAPHIQAAIRERQRRLIAVSGTNVALKTLMDVMQDPKAPASARVSAAKVMFDAAGISASKDAGGAGKPLHEMTYAELAAMVQKANDEGARRLSAPIPGVIIPQGEGEGEEDQEDSA